jgi:hypothetical protein
MSDREVLQAAFAAWDQAAGGSFVFGAGRTYDIGRLERGAPPFLIDGAVGASIIGAGARIRCDTVANIAPVFLVKRSRGLRIVDLRLHDRGYRPRVDWHGAVFVYVDGAAGAVSDVALTRLEADRAVALLICAGQHPRERIRGLTLDEVVARNCYYGVNCQENGDDLQCSMRAHNCRRAYFSYGVSGHRAKLAITGDRGGVGANACIVIARFERDTSDIAVEARFAGELAWGNLVQFMQKPTRGGVPRMTDVLVQIDVDSDAVDRAGARDAIFTLYPQPGAAATERPEPGWRNVRATGRGVGGRPVVAGHEIAST